ncbi:MAG: GNAT family N-acetyltransferase [Bacteriovoracaceae bacterium]
MLETERILFRELNHSDLEDLIEMDTNKEVLRFINPHKTVTEDEVPAGLERIISHYPTKQGLGIWATINKEGQEFMGWFCLKPPADTPEVEIGYRLKPLFWGKGYATEGASRLRSYGLDELKLEKVVAVTHPKHIASKNVLNKIGMNYIREKENRFKGHPEPFVSYFSSSS